MGDIYYRKMNWKEVFERGIHWESDPKKMLKSQYDINCYIRDNLNQKFPMDGPLWRAYAQEWKVDGKDGMILIWKSHHALMDGVSAISITAAGSMEYSKDYFFPSKDIGLGQ